MKTKKVDKQDLDATKVLSPQKFYDIQDLLKYDADVYMVVSERSNGKTFSTMKYLVEKYYKSGYRDEFVYLRRRSKHIAKNSFIAKWDGFLAQDMISKITNGEYQNILYIDSAKTFWLTKQDPETGKWIPHHSPMGYTASLSTADDWYGNEKPFVKTIWNEEFICKKDESYISNELTAWNNIISSIARTRDDVKLILTGNTTSFHSLYFSYYHKKDTENRKLADLDFGDIIHNLWIHPRNKKVKLKVVTELAKGYEKISGEVKPSDKYFLPEYGKSMITAGDWDVAEYYKLPIRFNSIKVKDALTYYLYYDQEYFKCTIKILKDEICTHHELTDLKKPPAKSIVFKITESLSPYDFINPLTPITYSKKTEQIRKNYINNRITFDSDETGAVVKQYITEASEFNALYL